MEHAKMNPLIIRILMVRAPLRRPSGAEDRTVVFLPDIWNHLATKGPVNVYKQVNREEVEVEEEVEVDIEVEEEGEAKEGA